MGSVWFQIVGVIYVYIIHMKKLCELFKKFISVDVQSARRHTNGNCIVSTLP